MILSHETKLKYLKKILEQNELKSSILTGSINQGNASYKSNQNNLVFFRAVKKITDIQYPEGISVILFFDSNILYNKSYWVSTVNSVRPSNWNSKTKITWKNNWENDPQYSIKYKQYYKNTKRVLKKLYLHSVSAGCICNTVAVLNKINIKNHLIAVVIFPGIKESKKTSFKKYIKKYYPHTTVYTDYWPKP